VGRRLTQRLEKAGIRVIHDTTLHDYPSYTGSYNNSRKAVQEYLEQYPSIKLVLDLHRDAALEANGKQMVTKANVNGETSAQLMLVVGTNASGLHHPNWQENMALAAKLHVVLEKTHEGITRPICFRAERFNQDLHPGMLLIEVGSAGNTQPQALLATDCLAEAIIALAHGAN
jgi:stage II sporulation protein P